MTMRADAPDDAIRFDFPCRTVSESNSRDDRWTKAARVKDQRKSAGWQTRAKVDHRELRHHQLTVKLMRVAPSAGLDDDNLRGALKAIRDGVADALGVDDRDPRVEWKYDQRRGPYAVEVTIERRST